MSLIMVVRISEALSCSFVTWLLSYEGTGLEVTWSCLYPHYTPLPFLGTFAFCQAWTGYHQGPHSSCSTPTNTCPSSRTEFSALFFSNHAMLLFSNENSRNHFQEEASWFISLIKPKQQDLRTVHILNTVTSPRPRGD